LRAGTFGILATLLVLLVGVACYAYAGLVGGDALPSDGVIALAIGALFSIIIGCGLMALLFYSSRHGYDEPPHYK
jgi:hypothetical protein